MGLPSRYEGRPILIIIENYALRVIGALSDEKAAGVSKIVQRVWGGDDDWMATVRAQLNWQPAVDDSIRQNWAGYRDAARKQGVTGTAEEFSMMFADAIEKHANTE